MDLLTVEPFLYLTGLIPVLAMFQFYIPTFFLSRFNRWTLRPSWCGSMCLQMRSAKSSLTSFGTSRARRSALKHSRNARLSSSRERRYQPPLVANDCLTLHYCSGCSLLDFLDLLESVECLNLSERDEQPRWFMCYPPFLRRTQSDARRSCQSRYFFTTFPRIMHVVSMF